MMSRLTKIALTTEERTALEKGYKFGKVHGFRQRCQMILLKSKQKPSREIAGQLNCCMVSVNQWVKRYQSEGIDGLHIKNGRGRKPILQNETDLCAVRLAVQANAEQSLRGIVLWQRLRLAQNKLQEELGKQFSRSTLKRFLKKTIADTAVIAERRATASSGCLEYAGRTNTTASKGQS